MISFREIGYLGRIGNQLFQFAATYGISKKLGLNPIFPEENTKHSKGTGPIDSQTGKRLETRLELRDCFDLSPDLFLPLSQIKPTVVYHETDFTYNPSVESLPNGSDLFGYFQTEKYFMESKEEIISALEFLPKHRANASNFFEEFVLNSTITTKISIHVRRGDYINLSDYHPPCSIEYYDAAAKKFQHLNPIFVIFSDDTICTKKNLNFENSVFVELNDPYAELCIMSQCDHNIIANSSFSWWGAYLNKNPNKVVVAPSRWFGKAMNKNTKDVYCQNWIVL